VLVELSVLNFGAHLPDLRDQGRLVSIHSVPNLVGYAVGRGGADARVRAVATFVLLAGAAVCAAVAWRRRNWPTAAGWAGLVAVACVSWLMPWYVLWALPFAALSRSRLLHGAVVLMTAGVIFSTALAPLVTPQLTKTLNHTAVGRANHRFEQSLVADHPRHVVRHRHRRRAARSNRKPTSRQPRRTATR
jgi:hypothetical protein